MAHEITKNRLTNKYEFAYAGQPAWHQLGAELSKDASIDEWKREAGMNWEVLGSPVSYTTLDSSLKEVTLVVPDKRVLFRSDTKDSLSIVSNDYHVVQPGEVLGFFESICKVNGFKLSAAGTLFGGKRFWATAEVGKVFNAVDDDEIKGQLLLVTSVDGTLATQAKFTSTRTVCNNTLTVALSENNKRSVRKTHASEWDADAFKLDLGLIDSGWEKFNSSIKKLTETKVSDSFARSFFEKEFYNPEKLAENQGIGDIKRVNTLMELYSRGTGAEYSKGTAYGILNAATEMFTHGISANRDPSHQFWNSYFGKDEVQKNRVFSDLVEMVAA
jgi:phage/plasmid-like protein (TIGR03299 family)